MRSLLATTIALTLLACGPADVVISEDPDTAEVTDTGSVTDTDLADTTPDDTGTPDTDVDDTATPDTGPDVLTDTGTTDTGSPDTAPIDTGATDTGSTDTATDTGSADTDVVEDTGPPLVCPADPACASVSHELPIPTHWSAAGVPRVVFNAADDPGIRRVPGLSPGDYDPAACYPLYDHPLPNVDAYIADTYATHAVSDTVARDWATELCEATGVPVRHVRPALTGRPGSLESGACVTQVVHASVAGEALFTVLLPPGWRADDPPGTHPIVIEGFYDIHDSVFRDSTATLGELVTRSGLEGRGVIGVIWNGGGAIGSASMNPRFDADFAAVIARVAADYGGASDWILTYGGSRGGISALRQAANATNAPMRVVFAIAVAPPTRAGHHTSLTSATYPGLLAHRATTLGLTNAWRSDFVYPACGGHAELTGLSAEQAHRYVLTGTADEATADAQSLVSDTFINQLVSQGTQLYVEITDHDAIVPYPHQVEFALELGDHGVRADVNVLLNTGHQPRFDPIAGQHHYLNVLERAVETINANDFSLDGPVPPFVATALTYWEPEPATGGHHIVHPAHFPVSVELPYRAYSGTTVPFVFTGPPGTHYSLWLENFNDDIGVLFDNEIPDSWSHVEWFSIPSEGIEGRYEWWLEYTVPGHAPVTTTRSATPTGATCTTEVLGVEPVIHGEAVPAALMAPGHEAFPSISWGITAY